MNEPDIPALARARTAALALSLVAIVGTPVRAADARQPHTVPLALDAAVALALERQPLLAEIEAEARAAREDAVAAAALPDPELFAGVRDVPIEDDDAFSLSNDSDTQLVIGMRQTLTASAKRRLGGRLRDQEADGLDLERERIVRHVSREASSAWIALWRDDRALALGEAQLREVELEVQSLAVAQRIARSSQSDVLTAELARERARDAVAALAQAREVARAELARWIGDVRHTATADLPTTPKPLPELPALLERLPRHPEIATLEARIAARRTAATLAAQYRRPDVTLALGYGHRIEFADMASFEVDIPLPLFARNRQDRAVASAQAATAAAEAERDDALLRLRAEIARLHSEAAHLDSRRAHYDAELLPRATAAVAAALAEWRSGRGALATVLAARRSELESRLARLDLERDAALRRAALQYFDASSGGES